MSFSNPFDPADSLEEFKYILDFATRFARGKCKGDFWACCRGRVGDGQLTSSHRRKNTERDLQLKPID
uniref:Uncharacterized protein n=1 Tax=Theropithecus gelada TaxID=9565 RepID=A0A8D2FNT5_THEGE